MATFLNTTGVSYRLEELIKNTKDKLILVSPYLKLNDRIKEHIKNLNVQKRDIRIIYRENKLHPDENNWLESQIGVRTSISKNLHAKCYLNESEAIITSMNLYEFSQANNNEMGIHITKEQDPELFEATNQETQRIITISEEIRVTVQKINPSGSEKPKVESRMFEKKLLPKTQGYCIRTREQIPFDPKRPLNAEAYKSWKKYGNADYPEKFCHSSGESSHGKTSVNNPIMRSNLNKANK